MGEACDGPCRLDLPVPEGGGIRSTPLEAVPAAERFEIVDTEYVALSDELVVEVRGVLHGDLDLDLTIRIRDDCGEAHEVCNDALELAACHPAPEERSSDAVSDLPAGAILGNSRAVVWADDETSGDDREVRAEIVSNARIEADAGPPADAVIDACAGEGRDSCVVASPCGTSEIEMEETGSTVMYDAARTEDVGMSVRATL